MKPVPKEIKPDVLAKIGKMKIPELFDEFKAIEYYIGRDGVMAWLDMKELVFYNQAYFDSHPDDRKIITSPPSSDRKRPWE